MDQHPASAEDHRDERHDNAPVVQDAAELLRVGTMLSTLSAELKQLDLDEPSVERLNELHHRAVDTLAENLDPSLADELRRFVPGLDDPQRSAAEVRVAHLQLVGWLEGLFRGIQVSAASRQQGPAALPGGAPGHQQAPSPGGTYL